MNRLGDVPADLLFGLIALNNNLVAPAVIPAALRARALEPIRTLAELLVSQGALTPVQRDLVETLSGEYIERGGGDALKGLATLIANPSARERLDQLGDLGLPESLSHAISLTTTLPREPDPTLDDPNHPLLPPTKIVPNSWPRVAGYQILEVLGSGGMGIVYKAHQERLDRFVALKMIRAGGGARPEDLARFETEAKAVAAIEHNNIVKIFDIGEQDGLPYFSLEYLSGGSLSQRIGGKPQPFDRGRPDRRNPGPCNPRRARAQGDPPRPEAGQCPLCRRRHPQDHRLRAGEAIGERLETNPQRFDPRHAKLHGSRTGPGRKPDRRAGRRPVCPGRNPLRSAHRAAAVPGNVGPRYP